MSNLSIYSPTITMTDLFKAQSLEDPRAESIQLDENVIAGKDSYHLR